MRPGTALGIALALVIAALPGLLLLEHWLPVALFAVGVLFAVVAASLRLLERREARRREDFRRLLDRVADAGEDILHPPRGPTFDAWRADAEALVSAAVGEEEAARAVGPPVPGVVADMDPMEVLAGDPFGGEYVANLRVMAEKSDGLKLKTGFTPSAWTPFDFRAWEAEHARPISWEPQSGGPCPWCGTRIYPSNPACPRCGAQIGRDSAFK
ncbi:MAG: hypothetical protein ACRDPE_20305 [Solirubrobacterales bacterium]